MSASPPNGPNPVARFLLAAAGLDPTKATRVDFTSVAGGDEVLVVRYHTNGLNLDPTTLYLKGGATVTSPTQPTLRHLRNEGWTAEVVERYNPHARVRNDLFGFVDVLALRGAETLAVQTTTDSNVSARVRKIADSPNLSAVREAGWLVHVHGWQKDGARWKLRVVDVS